VKSDGGFPEGDENSIVEVRSMRVDRRVKDGGQALERDVEWILCNSGRSANLFFSQEPPTAPISTHVVVLNRSSNFLPYIARSRRRKLDVTLSSDIVHCISFFGLGLRRPFDLK